MKAFSDRLMRKKLRLFLGDRVIGWIAVNFVCGFALFVVEFAFAFAMQLLLVNLGFPMPTGLPSSLLSVCSDLIVVLGFLLSIVIVRAVFQWLQTYVQNAVSHGFSNALRKRLLRWAFSAPSLKVSEIIPLFGDRSIFAGLMLLHFQQAAFFAFISVFLAATLLWIAFAPTFVAFVCLALLAVPLSRFSKKIQAVGSGLNEAKSLLDRRFYQDLRVFLFLKIYSKETEERLELERLLDGVEARNVHFFKLAGASSALPQIFGTLALLSIVLVMRKTGGAHEPTILIPYLYLFFRFTQNASQIANHWASATLYWPAFEEMAKWWAQHSHDRMGGLAEERRDAAIPRPANEPLGWDLKGVNFCYEGAEANAIKGLSLHIPPRSALAVIGPSGAGKSTLIALLLNQIDVQSGEIDLIAETGERMALRPHRESFLARIGYVGPEPFLFEGTVRQNLLFGLETPLSDQELKNVLDKTECGFIWEASKGLDHFLTDQGQGLSAGQKQRLALARALLRRPSVLILDEATSNLDTRTEAALIDILIGYKGQMTMLIVTHRESMLRLSDRVLSMEDGRARELNV